MEKGNEPTERACRGGQGKAAGVGGVVGENSQSIGDYPITAACVRGDDEFVW